MARLKAGSTVGGSTILTQGMIPLVPSGNSITYKGFLMYTQNDKPTKADVGLGNVNNWLASSSINNTSDTTYATAGAVKKAYDLANTKIPLTSITHGLGSSKDLVMSQYAVTTNLDTKLGKVGGVVGNLIIEHPENPNFPSLMLRKTSDNRYVVLETSTHSDSSFFNIIYREANGTNIAVMKFPKENSVVASQSWVDGRYYKRDDSPSFKEYMNVFHNTTGNYTQIGYGASGATWSANISGSWYIIKHPLENGTLATREWTNDYVRRSGNDTYLISGNKSHWCAIRDDGMFSVWNDSAKRRTFSVDVNGNTETTGSVRAGSVIIPHIGTALLKFAFNGGAGTNPFISYYDGSAWYPHYFDAKESGTVATREWSNIQHYAKTETYTRSDIEYRDNQRVPNGRTVNGKALSANITLTSGDVGAYAKGETYTRAEMDTRYPLKTNVYAKGETYTRAEIDSRVNGRLTQAQGDARYQKKGTGQNFRQIWSGNTWTKGDTITVSEDVRGKTIYIKGTGYLGGGIQVPNQINIGIVINWYKEFHLFVVTSSDGKNLRCDDSSWGIREVWIQD